MDEERFNLSLRKLLKQFGVTAQRKVEKAVDVPGVGRAGRQDAPGQATMVVEACRPRSSSRDGSSWAERDRSTTTESTPMGRWTRWATTVGLGGGLLGCQGSGEPGRGETTSVAAAPVAPIAARVAAYTTVRLTTDLSGLSDRERRMIPLLMDAAAAMDTIYQQQLYPAKDSLLSSLGDSATRRFVDINYGPWDRLGGDRSFVSGVGERPPGVELYPHDMSKEVRRAAAGLAGRGAAAPQSMQRSYGGTTPALWHPSYHGAWGPGRRAAEASRSGRRWPTIPASAATSSSARRRWGPTLPAERLRLAGRETNTISRHRADRDLIDRLGSSGTRPRRRLFIRTERGTRLARGIASCSPRTRGLPVPHLQAGAARHRLRPERVRRRLYAGDANTGLQDDRHQPAQRQKRSSSARARRLQLQNVMRAKFDRILVPIADRLIADDQRSHRFDVLRQRHVPRWRTASASADDRGERTVRRALRGPGRHTLEEGKTGLLGLMVPGCWSGGADRHDAGGPLRHLPREHLPVDPLRAPRAHGRANAAPTLVLRTTARSPGTRLPAGTAWTSKMRRSGLAQRRILRFRATATTRA
jgi:hypothetical protein